MKKLHYRKSKRFLVPALIGLAGVLSYGGPASAAFITFDGGSEGDLLGTIDGATFSNVQRVVPGEPRVAYTSLVAGGGTDKVNNDFGNAATNAGSVASEGVVTFSTAVLGLKFDVLDIDGNDQFTARIFDAVVGGTEIDSIFVNSGISGGDGSIFSVDFDLSTGIRRLEFVESFVGTNVITGYAIDNLEFTPDDTFAPVPVPAALPLLASAVAGLGFFARRRRNRVAVKSLRH